MAKDTAPAPPEAGARSVTLAQAALIDAGFRPNRHSGLVRLIRRLVWPFVRPFHFHTLEQAQSAATSALQLQRRVDRLVVEQADGRRRDAFAERLDGLQGDAAELKAASAALTTEIGMLKGELAELRAQAPVAAPEPVDTTRLDRIEVRLDLLEAGEDRRQGRFDALAAGAADVKRLTLTYTRVRSELLAIGNRHVWVEERAQKTLDEVQAARDALAASLDRLQAASGDHRRALDSLIADNRTTGLTLLGLENGMIEAGARLDRVAADGRDREARLDGLQAQLGPLQHGLFLAPVQNAILLLQAGELISETVRHDGVWDAHIIGAAERAVTVVRQRSAGPATLAVDVGAHFGLVTVALAALFDRVVSFEPNAFNATLLRINVLLNGLSERVEVRREALGASEGTVSLAPSERQEIPLPLDDDGHFAPRHASNLGAYSFVRDGTGLSEAPMRPLDGLELSDLAFIKVDVQGNDGAVLMGGMKTIARCRPWVVFEWEQKLSQAFGVPFQDVEAEFHALGYVVRVLHRHNQKQVDYIAVPADEAFALTTVDEASA